MKRAARLQSAVSWLKTFRGKNVLRGYCKQYGVDWRCAAIELKQLGVKLDPDYLKCREVAERELAAYRKRRCEARENEQSLDEWPEYETPLNAYLAGDHAAMYVMECEQREQERDTGTPHFQTD